MFTVRSVKTDFSTCEFTVSGFDAYIISLFTEEQYRGKGYGTQLLKSVIDFLRENGAKCVFLDDTGNPNPKKNIYGKFGFQVRKRNRFDREVWIDWKDGTEIIGPERRLKVN